ncbi:MAG: NAD(P)-dependent alcohol dehydrogenase [Candidatus Nanopelagicales bacterium]
MRAIVQYAYGQVDVLRLAEVAAPTAGAHDVVVEVVSAGVDAGVVHLMTGKPYLLRAVYGLRRPRKPILGLAFAGRVAAVGSDVSGLSVGDEVFGVAKGSFAHFARARADRVILKPAGLTFEQAAALPVSAVTALQAVRDKGKITAGQSVLVTGAGGGVGCYAVQLAKAAGASVTGVCSARKEVLVRGLGADDIIDYQSDDFADGARQWDVILDIAGNRPLRELRRALADDGTIVLVGGEAGGPFLGGMERNLGAGLTAPFTGLRVRTLASVDRAEDLACVAELVMSGSLRPVVDKVFPLADAGRAVRYVQEGRSCGKTVISG